MDAKILLVEDDAEIADFVVRGLREEGFSVNRAADGDEGWQQLRNSEWDVVLLDWWLPGTDGLTLLRRFRKRNQTTPVLFLTAREAVSDRVTGLDNGADDYLCKPFAFAELLARIRVMARRQDRPKTSYSWGDVQIDLATRRVERAGRRLNLTFREELLLVFLILAGLSAGILLAALFAVRIVCRHALAPVRRMAVAASGIGAEELERRLPAILTNDELGQLNRAFNGLLDRLQESFERQRRFTVEASHQLRTPLAGLLGQVEVALRRERPVEEYQRVLSTVHHRGSHLSKIVESLLFLSRANAEASLAALENLCLSSWLPEQIEAWSDHKRAPDIFFTCANPEPGFVRAHPALLGELLNVLVDNACKYSPPGSPIEIELDRDGREALIQVKDHGRGIAEADLRHLFTPFFRSEDARRHGIDGTGLGLSIATRLARLFDGELSVDSRLGFGSCFTLRLPLASPELSERSVEVVPT